MKGNRPEVPLVLCQNLKQILVVHRQADFLELVAGIRAAMQQPRQLLEAEQDFLKSPAVAIALPPLCDRESTVAGSLLNLNLFQGFGVYS